MTISLFLFDPASDGKLDLPEKQKFTMAMLGGT
jgi:hypothetical protein